ncbi:MAG TPA: hypothetical protein VLI06_09210 [Solimonas sp.]|nr:hypothetical protein [Solimonas sp.]
MQRLAAAVLLLPAAAAAAPLQPFVQIESFAHSEPVSVHAYVDDWEGPLEDDGADAVTHNWFETGVRMGPWSYSYVQRYDWELKATRDAAKLYHQVKNKIELVPGTTYDLEVRGYHNRSQGLRIAYAQQAGDWSIEPGLSLLSGQALINGRIKGNATALDDNEYGYDAAIRYFYDKDRLFDRRVDGPSGEGLSLDLLLRYRPGERWLLSLQARDLYGFLRWHDTPITEALATSDVREFDEDGYVRFRPTLTGREFNQGYTQRLHPHGLLLAKWSMRPDTRLGAQLRLTEVRQYPGLLAEHDFASGLQADVQLLANPFALGAGLRWQGFRLGVLSDRLKFEDAQLLQLELGWTMPL